MTSEAAEVAKTTATEEPRRDGGVYVLIWQANDGLRYMEFEFKKDVNKHIESIGGPKHIVKLYAGAKERFVNTVVSYTF